MPSKTVNIKSEIDVDFFISDNNQFCVELYGEDKQCPQVRVDFPFKEALDLRLESYVADINIETLEELEEQMTEVLAYITSEKERIASMCGNPDCCRGKKPMQIQEPTK